MRRSAIQPNRRLGTRRNCNGGFRDISGQVDELTWHLGDWPDWNKQIGKDSGWWVRRVEGEVARIIVLNFDKVVTQTEAETISLNFEEAFEGRLDRTGDGWTIKPDDFNARPQVVWSSKSGLRIELRYSSPQAKGRWRRMEPVGWFLNLDRTAGLIRRIGLDARAPR